MEAGGYCERANIASVFKKQHFITTKCLFTKRENTSVEKGIVPLQKEEDYAYTASLGMTYWHLSCYSLLHCQFAQ